MKTICSLLILLALGASTARAQNTEGLPITFQLNDALIKGKLLASVEVGVTAKAVPDGGEPEQLTKGETDKDGRLNVSLPAGEYLATYRKPGYVAIEASPFTVSSAGQVITTSLTPMLETGASRQRVIRVVLNWGSDSSQTEDVDAHVAIEGGQSSQEVYYSEKRFDGPGPFSMELDVDDMHWGGPETITLTEPPPGRYLYWVHNFSADSSLGQSEVVVRVFIDDRPAGEFRAPRGADQRYYRPFKAIVVGDDLGARVEELDSQAMVASEHLNKPAGPWTEPGTMDCEGCEAVGGGVFLIIASWIGIGFARRRR